MPLGMGMSWNSLFSGRVGVVAHAVRSRTTGRRAVSLRARVFFIPGMGALGPRRPTELEGGPVAVRPMKREVLEGPPQEAAQLADDSAAEGEHADDEDGPLDDGDPGAELGQVVLQRGHNEGADDRTEHRPQATEERH